MTTTKNDTPDENDDEGYPRIAVHYEQLTTAADTMREGAEQLGSDLTQLVKDVEPLLSTWTGATAEAYTRLWAKRHDAATMALDGVGELAEVLSDYVSSTKSTDAKLAQFIRTGRMPATPESDAAAR